MYKKTLYKLHRKTVFTLLSMLLVISFAASAASGVFADGVKKEEISVQQQVYDFLTKEMELCPAAAAGIMGNIMVESRFDPTIEVPDVDGLPSFGLIMWHGARYEALKKWCIEKKYDKTDVKAQLEWLKYELENTEKPSYAAMKKIPNTMEGAAQAAIQWAELFERCTKRSYYLRILHAVNTYWPDYAEGAASDVPGIYGYYFNVPENVQVGKPLTIIGAVVSYSVPLNSLTVTIYDKNGASVEEETIRRSVPVYNINIIDRNIIFNRIPEGKYTYAITAETEDGPVLIGKYPFTVSKEPTKDKLVYEAAAEAACLSGAICPGAAFTDMPPVTSWSHDGIDFAIKQGLFDGTSPTTFEPEEKTNRAMFVTILWRLAGRPEPNSKDCPYDDVIKGSYYEKAVIWANENKVTNGVSETSFDPEAIITREMFVTLLHRFDVLDILKEESNETGTTMKDTEDAETNNTDDVKTDDETSKDSDIITNNPSSDEPNVDNPQNSPKEDENVYDSSILKGFLDYQKVSDWANEAMAWAIGNGIVSGNLSSETGEVLIDPYGASTRAQSAVMLARYLQE